MRRFLLKTVRGKRSQCKVVKNTEIYKFFLLAAVVNLDVGFTALAEDLEREVLDIRLNLHIVELATNETFCVEDTTYHALEMRTYETI